MTFNNDFGKTYKEALAELLPAAGLEIVADVVHEPTSDLSNEVTQLLAAGPDVIIGGTTSTFCTSLMTLARQGGFTGPIINSYTCQAIEQFMVPAGEAAANVHTLVVLKDPADPAFADDPDDAAVPGRRGRVRPRCRSQHRQRGHRLQRGVPHHRCAHPGRGDGGRAHQGQPHERVLVVRRRGARWRSAAWLKVDGVTDAYVAEYGVMAEFDPAATGYKTAEGVEVDVEGTGGVFGG